MIAFFFSSEPQVEEMHELFPERLLKTLRLETKKNMIFIVFPNFKQSSPTEPTPTVMQIHMLFSEDSLQAKLGSALCHFYELNEYQPCSDLRENPPANR